MMRGRKSFWSTLAVSVVMIVAGASAIGSSAFASVRQVQAEKDTASTKAGDSEGKSPASTSKSSKSSNLQHKTGDRETASKSTSNQQPARAEETHKGVARRGSHRKAVPGGKADQPTIGDKLSKAKSDLLAATEAYKTSLANLLPYEERAVKNGTDQAKLRQSLYEKGIVSRKELEDSNRNLAEAQAKLDETKRQLSESDSMLAEIEDDKYLTLPSRPGEYQTIGAVIRYNGTTQWSLKDAGKVENFYESEFGKDLPISAFGQTAVHDRLGFDHHNAMDVALEPDSPQGEALMEYLRNAGIPFIAFRHAVPGSATGAHIHIGKPSHRISIPETASAGH